MGKSCQPLGSCPGGQLHLSSSGLDLGVAEGQAFWQREGRGRTVSLVDPGQKEVETDGPG